MCTTPTQPPDTRQACARPRPRRGRTGGTRHTRRAAGSPGRRPEHPRGRARGPGGEGHPQRSRRTGGRRR
eukprot:7972469-Alexandrium_andersonii.AAC.1